MNALRRQISKDLEGLDAAERRRRLIEHIDREQKAAQSVLTVKKQSMLEIVREVLRNPLHMLQGQPDFVYNGPRGGGTATRSARAHASTPRQGLVYAVEDGVLVVRG